LQKIFFNELTLQYTSIIDAEYKALHWYVFQSIRSIDFDDNNASRRSNFSRLLSNDAFVWSHSNRTFREICCQTEMENIPI